MHESDLCVQIGMLQQALLSKAAYKEEVQVNRNNVRYGYYNYLQMLYKFTFCHSSEAYWPFARRCGRGDTSGASAAAASVLSAGSHWVTSHPYTGIYQTAQLRESDARDLQWRWKGLEGGQGRIYFNYAMIMSYHFVHITQLVNHCKVLTALQWTTF